MAGLVLNLRDVTERRQADAARERAQHHLGQLRQFLPPAVAEALAGTDARSLLDAHRRDVAVVFCDLRGFTSLSLEAEPEEVMAVLREYHAVLSAAIHAHGGTVGHFAGDGLMVFFNDPVPCPSSTRSAPAPEAAGTRDNGGVNAALVARGRSERGRAWAGSFRMTLPLAAAGLGFPPAAPSLSPAWARPRIA